MKLDRSRLSVRQHLEAAVRLQRESWDEVLAIQQVTGDQDRDIYAFVAELAGAGLSDDDGRKGGTGHAARRCEIHAMNGSPIDVDSSGLSSLK